MSEYDGSYNVLYSENFQNSGSSHSRYDLIMESSVSYNILSAYFES